MEEEKEGGGARNEAKRVLYIDSGSLDVTWCVSMEPLSQLSSFVAS